MLTTPTDNQPHIVTTTSGLYSLSVELRPIQARKIQTINGLHLNAAFLRLLGTSDVDLSQNIHDMDGQKPYTVSNLLPKHQASQPHSTYSWRLTFLNEKLFAYFINGAFKRHTDIIMISGNRFHLDKILTTDERTNHHNFTTYSDILNNSSSAKKLMMQFQSPTVFRSGGKRNVIFPEPRHFFGSLFARWQAFSPIKLSESALSWCNNVSISKYSLSTCLLDFGAYQELGFLGWCEYNLGPEIPDEAVCVFNTLADYAYYCGTGAKTTMGMGQTRKIQKTVL